MHAILRQLKECNPLDVAVASRASRLGVRQLDELKPVVATQLIDASGKLVLAQLAACCQKPPVHESLLKRPRRVESQARRERVLRVRGNEAVGRCHSIPDAVIQAKPRRLAKDALDFSGGGGGKTSVVHRFVHQ